jgi:hypothetical protein
VKTHHTQPHQPPRRDERPAQQPDGDHVTLRTERRQHAGDPPQYRSILTISQGGQVTRDATEWATLDRFTADMAVHRGREKDALRRWVDPWAAGA